MPSVLGNNIKSDLYHIYVTYVQPTGAGEAGKVCDSRGETDRQEGWIRSDQRRRPRAGSPGGPDRGGEEGGPGRRQKVGLQERAGSPQEESWEARQESGGGGEGDLKWGAPPWTMGPGGIREHGGLPPTRPGSPEGPVPCRPPAHLGTQLDELRSTSQVAYRFICTGAGVRPGPGPPGGAEPEATATAMEVEVDEDEEEAAAAEVDEDDEVAWASLGGVGCCGAGCCDGGGCCGDWATPEPRWPLPPPAPPGPPPAPPRSAMARPGWGSGAAGIAATPSRRPAFSRGGGGGSARLLSPPARARERASERLHARAGPAGARSSRSPAAACCGSRRRDTGWACPGRGRGAPARARPTQPRGAGPRLALAPRPPVGARPPLLGEGSAAGARSAGLFPSPRAGGSQLALSSPLPSFSRRRRQPGQRKSRFSGARPRPGGSAAGARLGPLGFAEPRQNPQRAQASFPTAPWPPLCARGFFATISNRGDEPAATARAPPGREVPAPASLQCGQRLRDLESKMPLHGGNYKTKPWPIWNPPFSFSVPIAPFL